MLNAYPTDIAAGAATPANLKDKIWVDLISPTPEEIKAVEQAFSLHLPSRADLSEIENSSRLRTNGDVLYMSAPLIGKNEDGSLEGSPTGFILCSKACITLRYRDIGAMDAVIEKLKGRQDLNPGDIFVDILEEVVDRAADKLESSGDTLNQASHSIFSEKAPKKAKVGRDTNVLRDLMKRIGRASEHMSIVRYTLVCLVRMTHYVEDRAQGWIEPPCVERLHAVRADIASLEQYEENLLSRIQLLQDAATAFISIEQNDVVKVLTIASVVGIPPVLIVGVYGMNFKDMPELTWTYGYPYALGLMAVSMIVPLVWFKIKDWM
jgi:magnesium transporter